MIDFLLIWVFMCACAVVGHLFDPHGYGNWVNECSPSFYDIFDAIRWKYYQWKWRRFEGWRQ